MVVTTVAAAATTRFTSSIASLAQRTNLNGKHRIARTALSQTIACRCFVVTQQQNKKTNTPTGGEEEESKDGSSSTLTSHDISSAAPTSPLLSQGVLQSIKNDLIEADVNHDGRIDYEELKLILRKYQERVHWSDDDIDAIGDLFFVGTAGGSVKHFTFLRSIQHTAVHAPPQDNPLHLESIADDRCWTAQAAPANNPSLYRIQDEFDNQLLKYIREKIILSQSHHPTTTTASDNTK